MTELAQKAVAEIMKAVREIKNPSTPVIERYEKGDFFMVGLSGSSRSTADRRTEEVAEPRPTEIGRR